MTWLYTHIILHKPGISCSKPVRKNRVASIRSSNHARCALHCNEDQGRVGGVAIQHLSFWSFCSSANFHGYWVNGCNFHMETYGNYIDIIIIYNVYNHHNRCFLHVLCIWPLFFSETSSFWGGMRQSLATDGPWWLLHVSFIQPLIVGDCADMLFLRNVHYFVWQLYKLYRPGWWSWRSQRSELKTTLNYTKTYVYVYVYIYIYICNYIYIYIQIKGT